jgi:hypothetical protein
MDDKNGVAPRTPRVRIPREYRSGFAKIIELSSELFQELLTAIEEEPPALYYTEFSARVARRASDISSNDVRDIVETLVSLHGVRASWNLKMPDLIEIVSEAAERDEELKLSDEKRGSFEERLALLLGVNSLDATSKALDVLLEQEHTLHDVRIMTDVRPIFGQDTRKPPIGTVIVHMLKLSYHDESEEVKEFYVALDTGDTGVLSAELERADQKAESLKRMLEATGVPYIDAG